MRVPYDWLAYYVDLADVSPKIIRDTLTLRGLEISSYEELHTDIQNVVVGKILSIEKHQDSDHLQICQVDVGEEILQIVTGAQNIAVDDLVPIALVGATLPGDVKIKKGKLRGAESAGMMCSGKELSLKSGDFPNAEVDGIMILPKDFAIGADVKPLIGLGGIVFEAEPTPNRPDCLSIIGIARELAAALDKELKMPPMQYTGTSSSNIDNYAKVEVLDPQLCPRYMAKTMRNLHIEPSPRWMQFCLRQAGLRPINNIVDITNFVMLEFGQPMHAFDFACIDGNKIIVRTAEQNEKIITLDSKPHVLCGEMLVIADTKKAVGIAGVMGGENSEITINTKTMLLESALFNGANIRKTSKALGVSTDASLRFSKGVDIETVENAINRACNLIETLQAGEIDCGVIDVCSVDTNRRKLVASAQKVNRLLALNLTAQEMAEILTKLSIPTKADGDELKLEIPHFRDDIEGQADVAEEIARVIGHNNISPTLMKGDLMRGRLTKTQILTDKVRELLCAMGAYEAITYAFTGEFEYDKLQLPKDSSLRMQSVRLMNPFGEDNALMRTTLAAGMLNVLSTNANRKIDHARFFEICNVHRKLDGEVLPKQTKMLSIGIYGKQEDFFTLKGMIENLLKNLDSFQENYIAGGEECFHPGRRAILQIDNNAIGQFGEIHPKTRENFDISARCYFAEIDLDALLSYCETQEKWYKPLAKYPAMERDLALVVDEDIESASLVHTIQEAGGKLLESVELFDVYQGEHMEEGKKSLAYKLCFRSNDRTLTDEEVSKLIEKILKQLSDKHGALIRQ